MSMFLDSYKFSTVEVFKMMKINLATLSNVVFSSTLLINSY